MTTDIERQFYDTFGIERLCDKSTYKLCVGALDCQTCKYPYYPQITDRILLELICIYNVFVRMDFYSSYVKDLKIEVLETLIKEYKNRKQTDAFDENLKEKIRTLFEDENFTK